MKCPRNTCKFKCNDTWTLARHIYKYHKATSIRYIAYRITDTPRETGLRLL